MNMMISYQELVRTFLKGAITIAISKNIRVSCIVMSVAKLTTFVFLIKNDFIIVSKIT